MKALRYLILLFLQAFCFIAFSQKQRIKFEHIGTNSGLSQSNVMSIFQDSRGFMWFGTRDGLNKYDGYKFTVYKYDIANENSPSHNTIQDIADLGTAINETGAEIKTEQLPVVNGYLTEIKELFQNLIINAIKFREKTIPPQINISVQKISGYWQFAFKDNGIGIEEQHREKIFNIFQRLHNRTEYEGSGIGLAHCKKIVELHHGKIWVESTPGLGSTFHFTIRNNRNGANTNKE